MSNSLVPLPDGMTVDAIENLDLEQLAKTDPEQASIWADMALKHYEANKREAWLRQAVILYVVSTYTLWAYHPAGYNSFNEWLMQPDIDIPQSVSSDMVSFVAMAEEFKAAGINLFQTFRDAGQSKIRRLMPVMRKAKEEGTLIEQVGPMLPQIAATATVNEFNEVIDMINPSGSRTNFDPEVILKEHDDGTFSLLLHKLDFDQMEMAARKLNIRRWFDDAGHRIQSPIMPLPAHLS